MERQLNWNPEKVFGTAPAALPIAGDMGQGSDAMFTGAVAPFHLWNGRYVPPGFPVVVDVDLFPCHRLLPTERTLHRVLMSCLRARLSLPPQPFFGHYAQPAADLGRVQADHLNSQEAG
jgi:hypothetical protein